MQLEVTFFGEMPIKFDSHHEILAESARMSVSYTFNDTTASDFLPIHTVNKNKNTDKWQIVRIQFGSHVSKHPQNVREFKWKMVCRVDLQPVVLVESFVPAESNGMAIFIGHLPNGDALHPAVVDDNNAHK